MRQDYLAEFAHFFGIRPWEWDELDMQDVRQLITEVDAIRAENKKAAHG